VTAIFITATGTDVGKTFVAAALIRHLRQMGHAVEAIKPIVSGFDPARVVSSDPGVLLAALGRTVSAEEIDRISPWRFRASLSPDIAAKREGRSIDVDAVIEFSQRTIAEQRGIVLIEGVGGIMVPLDEQRTVLDWMMALRVPLILVTGSYLGTISHTLTALDSLFRRELDVLAIIVSETPGSAVPLDETVKAIERFVNPIGVIGLPRGRGRNDGGAGLGRIFGQRAQRSSGSEPGA
jgi:dethiobiotin synthetase